MGNLKNLEILTGNEAIARGAYEAGVTVATAYPGTPSTEILENISKYREIYSEWSVNEKVALEVASGASLAGARTLAAMKHVGLNVAADPFMTLSYTGITGGLVLVSADDPHLHSSQNEQDNRFYAWFAKIPMLEPSDSQEARDYVIKAFEISEEFDTPVLLRTTTRISHSGSLVKSGKRVVPQKGDYRKNCQKYVMIPAFGRVRHREVLKRWENLKNFVEKNPLNKIFLPEENTLAERRIGIITSGICYQYTREIFTNVPILKLGITSPLPVEIIKGFSLGKKLIIVIEELEPYIEEHLLKIGTGVQIIGKSFFPRFGEINQGTVEELYNRLSGTDLINGESSDKVSGNLSNLKSFEAFALKTSLKNSDLTDLKKSRLPSIDIPQRPPVLCAGCSHRSVFYVLKKLKLVVNGDIGCYTLSVLPPLNSLDSCLCMGAGIGQALGMEKADKNLRGKIVSVIGDSTFFHSGITSMIDNLYNRGTGVIIILDNRITAMTGHQVHPGTGKTLMGEDTFIIRPEEIARSIGVKNVRVVDPYDMKLFERVIKEELKKEELSVIVARRECVLLNRHVKKPVAYIDQNECKKCGACLNFGCPAIEYREEKYYINEAVCNGCMVCTNVCKKNAIKV